MIASRTKKTALLGTALILLFLTLRVRYTTEGVDYDNPATTEEIKSLPYLTWVPAGETEGEKGVVKHDEAKVYDGVNIYNSRNLSEAYLVDMSGRVLHTWSAPVKENTSWQHVEMSRDGDLFVILKDKKLLRLDWDSRVKMVREMRVHHDIAIEEGGDIYVLVRRGELVFHSLLPVPILNEYIVVMSPEGKVKREISLFEVLEEEIPRRKFTDIYLWLLNPKTWLKMVKRGIEGRFLIAKKSPADIFHANTIEVIDQNLKGLFNKGDLLISAKMLDFVGVLDRRTEKIIWKWGPGHLSKQHHPTLLDNGHILIFDNGSDKGYSRVVELDPGARRIVWEYTSNPRERFFSISRGASQRLPNGNTLVTESDKGHVFEVTRDGEIVWEFYNPVVDGEKRASIYRLMRVIDSEHYPRLKSMARNGEM